MPEVRLSKFSYLNHARQFAYSRGPHTGIELVACIAEECGEVAAAWLKSQGVKPDRRGLTIDDLADEIADAVTYLDLLATKIGRPLYEILPKRFDAVSKRTGFPHRLTPEDT